ncbi:MAG TPA: response regulator [Candidatus Hydrogenedentes bacterium]|nr:response regulator [Candidatus Hydrogenedentota bacterium]HOV74799.1 response regulator [Candidatus Hydrogenedentota bacterium]HPC16851.1 response regulator [Candidatus Hydrogenedentota bacterium]HRT21326.1 response regulator [Candidatus Hydrogenedentota bacterium]HRT66139.1 response regulator [Candidatus Hydrogenedentota bacterium]
MARILIVDDDIRTAQFIGANLQAQGHECTVASKGEDALALARAHPIDLMILDVMMPGGASGFQICRQLRSDPELYALPILILSAMSGEEEIRHGLAQGADDYIGKPFDMQNLAQRVEMLLRANADIKSLDEMTSLPAAGTIKRELQRRISCQEEFTTASVELMRLREFAYQCGKQSRVDAIRHLARILKALARQAPEESCLVGHMGGGYFICLLHPAQADAYCEGVVKAWRENVGTLYANLGQEKTYRDAVAAGPFGQCASLIDVLVCITGQRRRDRVSSQGLFDTLTQLRNKALASGVSGIHANRRM